MTFEDFKELCYETDYIRGKGRSSTSLSVDKIIDELGYVKGNIRVISVADNSRKELERRRAKKVLVYDPQTKWATVRKSNPADQIDSVF